MFKTSEDKVTKRAAKYDRRVRKFAAEEALKGAKVLVKPGDSQQELEDTRKFYEELLLHEFRQLGHEKFDIECRMVSTLSQRCGQERALELVNMIDVKGQDKETLMKALIHIVQHPELCRGSDADIRRQWNAFVEPYRDKSEEIKAALRAQIEADEQRAAMEIKLRESETRRAEREAKLKESETRRAEVAERQAEELRARLAKYEPEGRQPGFFVEGHGKQRGEKRSSEQSDANPDGAKKRPGRK